MFPLLSCTDPRLGQACWLSCVCWVREEGRASGIWAFEESGEGGQGLGRSRQTGPTGHATRGRPHARSSWGTPWGPGPRAARPLRASWLPRLLDVLINPKDTRQGRRTFGSGRLLSWPWTHLRRRSPRAAPRRTTRRSWCCRSCQRWIRAPSTSEEAASGRGQGGLEQKDVKTKHRRRKCPWGRLPDSTQPINHFLE